MNFQPHFRGNGASAELVSYSWVFLHTSHQMRFIPSVSRGLSGGVGLSDARGGAALVLVTVDGLSKLLMRSGGGF